MLHRASGISARQLLDEEVIQTGGTIVTEFFQLHFGFVDSQDCYLLVRINPPMSDDGEYEYSGRTVYSFAFDAIFQKLMEKHKVEMLAGAAAMFNCETASSQLH